MKINIGLIFFVLLFAACSSETKKVGENNLADTNGIDTNSIGSIWLKQKDGVIDTLLVNKTDTIFVIKPKPIADDMGDKREDYVSYFYFSNKAYPILTHKNAIGADIFFVDDLDKDGKQELLLRPDWFSSCWASLNLYSVKNGSWKLIKQGSMYYCSDQYPLSKRIISTDKGYAMLTDSLADDKFITLKKEIKF